MSARKRIFIGILLVYTLGLAVLVFRAARGIDPHYRDAAEESLVETTQLLASLVEQDLQAGVIDTTRLGPVFQSLYARRFQAQIHGMAKTKVELRMLVSDRNGRMVFDSTGKPLDPYFNRWRDVQLALAGQYGARTTPDTPDTPGQPGSAVVYVSAPVRWMHGGQTQIVGVVTLGKPTRSLNPLMASAREKIILLGLAGVLPVLLLAVLAAVWPLRPRGLLGDWWAYARSQRPFSLATPLRLGRRALNLWRAAHPGVGDNALPGHSHAAHSVQTLAREAQNPLSAIRGAAQLLQEPMPAPQRQYFLHNIQHETLRIQEMLDRMAELTALETRRVLVPVQPVDLAALLHALLGTRHHTAAQRHIGIHLAPVAETRGAWVEGDPALLRQALGHLIDNALDFAPSGSTIEVMLWALQRQVLVAISDQGPGIPDTAHDTVFEKFYSQARPQTQKKSTGLGLSFVQEIARLHQGHIELKNRPVAQGLGAVATLSLPRLAHAPRG